MMMNYLEKKEINIHTLFLSFPTPHVPSLPLLILVSLPLAVLHPSALQYFPQNIKQVLSHCTLCMWT